MSIFQTQYSTLKTDALNKHLAKNYGLVNTSCQLIIRNVSDTWIKYRGELELLNILKAGAKIAYPVSDLQGNQIQHSCRRGH